SRHWLSWGTVWNLQSKLSEQWQSFGLDSELLFHPAKMTQDLPRTLGCWTEIVIGVLSGLYDGGKRTPIDTWVDLIFEIFLAADKECKIPMEADRRELPSSDWPLGIQSHGFTALSDITGSIAQPILRRQGLHQEFHETSATYRTHSRNRDMEPLRWLERCPLDCEKDFAPGSTRLDVEPEWEGDPQTVTLRPEVNWFRLHATDLTTYKLEAITSGKLANLATPCTGFLIDASQSATALAYVLATIDTNGTQVAIAKDCLTCAYEHLQPGADEDLGAYRFSGNRKPEGGVIVIAPGNPMKESQDNGVSGSNGNTG
ncbi:hypothetical protein QBC36DRAFT_364831, partial [Triangularia setosa]